MFAKQLLYLTNDQLTAYQWEKGRLSSGHAFQNDDEGWNAFSRHLASDNTTPIYLLADLIEEDFQRENLPHVLGTARKKLIQRRLGQLYRDTPYRQATYEGREKEGRKDDRMLFSALTNTELLKPWLDAILSHQAPLAGIYSPALLSTRLVRKLGIDSDHLLLVTLQSSGLRQSYFQGNHLKFSRLTPMSDHSPGAIAEAIETETSKIYQFLTSTRLLPRDVTLQVATLSHGEGLRQLQEKLQDSTTLTHIYLDQKVAAQRLGLKHLAFFSMCDPLYLSLLGHAAPSSHYALPEQTRYFLLLQVRAALYGLSLAALASGVALAASNSLDALDYNQQTRQLTLEASATQAQYQAIARSLPASAASPQDMRAAVEIEQTISRNAPRPDAILGLISRSLEMTPQIRIDHLHWQTGDTPENAAEPASPQAAGNPPVAGGEEAPLSPSLIGIPGKPNQTVEIEGEVTSFKNDYRTALESVRLFAGELGKHRQIKAEITHPPLDIRPSVRLEGKSGSEDSDARARFTLKITWKPEA